MAAIEEKGTPISDNLDIDDKDNDAQAAVKSPPGPSPLPNRRRTIGFLLIFAILVGATISVLMSVNFADTNNGALPLSDPDQGLLDTQYPIMEPSNSPSIHPTESESAAPTSKPSLVPSMAPTVPQMGCRRDRFDNEGNRQENNHLFAGSYVCSNDSDQRYRFGIDPETANLILRDSLTGQVRTYYWNEWHWNESSSLPSDQLTAEQTNSATLSLTAEPTVLDYFFTLSTKGAFRIWRVQRTEDYQVYEKNLHWELPSLFEIPTVYEDCLLKHDCPYMHLHEDGVMVLAWLDFENSEYFDGWMEKNIRRCYAFNTTDSL
jgi:hypothetical protein